MVRIHISHKLQGFDKYASRFRRRRKSNGQSFLWTVVRDPTSRFLSNYQFRCVTHGGTRLDDSDREGGASDPCASFQQYVNLEDPHFYLTWLSMTESGFDMRLGRTRRKTTNRRDEKSELIAEINGVVNEYDFVGVVERYDESLVVLAMLLHLPLADILYFSSKGKGGLVVRQGKGTLCRKSKSFAMDEGTRRYIESPLFERRIESDSLLYRAMNTSLDLTIDKLGRGAVESNVLQFQQAQEMIAARCPGKVKMPCSEEGAPPLPPHETDCLTRDWGCGFDCLDEIATELDLW